MQRIMRIMWMLAATLALSVGTMAAQAHNWAIDKAHSKVDFSAKQNGSTLNGSFRAVSGTIRYEYGNSSVWSVNATIDMNSVTTGQPDTDQALKSPQSFDVAKYPTMTFKSSNVKTKNSAYLITGNLTLHGVTKPVTLSLDPPGADKIGMDATSVHCEFKGTATINPRDFGLNSNGGEAALGNAVNIKLDIQAVRE